MLRSPDGRLEDHLAPDDGGYHTAIGVEDGQVAAGTNRHPAPGGVTDHPGGNRRGGDNRLVEPAAGEPDEVADRGIEGEHRTGQLPVGAHSHRTLDAHRDRAQRVSAVAEPGGGHCVGDQD